MGMSEADTRAELIDPIIRTKDWVFPYIKREESGRAEHTLRVDVNAGTQSVAVALIEAKSEDLPRRRPQAVLGR